MLKHQVEQKKLRLSLYELDASRTRMVLGHVIVKLDDLQVAEGGIHYMCRNMQMQATLVIFSFAQYMYTNPSLAQ